MEGYDVGNYEGSRVVAGVINSHIDRSRERERMEGEEIGVALARASELRSKFTRHIRRCAAPVAGAAAAVDGDEEEEGEEEEAESLVSIRDALESLEQQLSALQALQHQQSYEREAALAQIDRSRTTLLSKLKEYKGEDLEVIKEASTFASESIEQNEDLLLPPYPSHLPDLYALDDLYPSARFSSKNRSSLNKLIDDVKTKNRKEGSGDALHNKPLKRNTRRGLGFIVGLVTRSVITVVGVVSVLSLAGFKPTLEKRSTQLNILELFSRRGIEDKREVDFQFPPAKNAVLEDEKPRSLGKERVEIPFELGVRTPKIGYGSG